MNVLLKKIKTFSFLVSSINKIINLHFTENYRKLKRTKHSHEENYFPTSIMQKNLLIIEKLKNNISAYNITHSIHFIGKIDFRKFQLALSELVKKHEILRTTFHEEKNEFWQKVEKPSPVSIQYMDYTADDALTKETNYKLIYDKLSRKQYSFDQLPLFDVVIFQINSEEFRIIFNFSHLIADGYTVGLFLEELGQLYKKDIHYFSRNYSYHHLQYADYAVWEQKYANSFNNKHLDFWRSYLSDVTPIDLHLMKKSADEEKFQKANTLRHTLDKGVFQKLATFKKKYKASTFQILLATFFVLMHRLSMQEVITLGFPRANRKHPKLLNIYGTFLNTLLISEKVDASATFIELLNKLKHNLHEVYQHESVPYGEIVKHLKPRRVQKRNPYFDILFNYLSKDWRQGLKLENAKTFYEDFRSAHAELMLTWYMIYDHEDNLVIFAKYSQSWFDAAAMTQLFEQYDSLLNQVLENPEKVLVNYSLIYPDEKIKDLQKLEDAYRKDYHLEHYQFDILAKTAVEFPKPVDPIDSTPQPFVSDLISAHAKANPSYPAVEYDGKSWTYEDLIHTANNICKQLVDRGLQKGDIVGIHGDHSFGMYAAMIGTWNAGGVIMMIDPVFPSSYKQELMKLAEVSLLIDLKKETSPSFSNEKVLDIHPLEILPDTTLQVVQHQPDDPAYIFFTSGTTGHPKGIKGNHRGLSHFVCWQKDTFTISPADRCAQITNVTFDVVLRSILTPLISGATLVIPNKNEGIESGNFFHWLDIKHITLLHIVPTLAEVLLNNPPDHQLSQLRCVFFAGEPLKNHLVKKWRTRVSDQATIVNLYGPTETTLAKAYFVVPKEPYEGVQPIGKPISQTQIFIFNEQLQQCGIGEEGEIIIRTPNRTLGYLQNTTEVENQFFQNPFNQDKQDLLYRTGDMGYLSADGTLFILGRKDDQVKINGIRVSPHNIATIISKVAGVKQCIVLPKNKKLIAYIVPEDPTSTDELKHVIMAFLRGNYPKFFTPHDWVFLDNIPTTSRGKVDKTLLPDPKEETESLEVLQEDLNEIEAKLLRFCQQELKLNIKSKSESLFESGVDSLDAISLLTYINGEFNLSMKFGDLYQHQTISSIYSWMQDSEKSNTNVHLTVNELSSYIQLEQDNLQINRGSPSEWENPKNILVTGASGFLGSFLLNDLLKAFPSATFYCLIRARTEEQAMNRLKDKFKYYSLNQIDSLPKRVIPLLGDLAKPELALKQTEYDFINQHIDSIYHCGAYVNFLLNFYELYYSNIEATKHIIKIALTHKIKPLHYVSTAGIFPLSERYAGEVFLEQEAVLHPSDILYGGYAQTKWVAERIVDQARASGLPVAVYRPGTISGDSNTGIWQKEDAVASFILGCIELGYFPNVKTTLDLASVDLVSQAIVYISQQTNQLGSIFNMINPNRVSIHELVDHLNRILNKEMKIIEYEQWRKLLMQSVQSKSKNALMPFVPLLPESLDKIPRLKFNRYYDSKKFLQAVKPLSKNDHYFPIVDDKLLSNYLKYLFSVNREEQKIYF